MQSIRRAGEALRLMASQQKELSVADTARHLNVTAATASRILASLRECHIIEQNPETRRYRPGILAFRLARAFELGADPIEDIHEPMEKLVKQTQHTSWAGILEGIELVVLKSRHGNFPVRYSVPIGGRLPAADSAMGKALLALQKPDDVLELYNSSEAVKSANVNFKVDDLLAELSEIRKIGYAVSDQQLFSGVKSVAVAFDAAHLDRPIALGISYPTFAVESGEDEKIVTALVAEAKRYGAKTGDVRWTAQGHVTF